MSVIADAHKLPPFLQSQWFQRSQRAWSEYIGSCAPYPQTDAAAIEKQRQAAEQWQRDGRAILDEIIAENTMTRDEALFDMMAHFDHYLATLFRDHGAPTIRVNDRLVVVPRGLAQAYYGQIHICERFVDRTDITDDAYVSTCFIGNTFGNDYLFETMVFGGPLNSRQMRCNTSDEARKNHRVMVREAQLAQKQVGKPCSRPTKKALARLKRTLTLAKKRGEPWTQKKMRQIVKVMEQLHHKDPIRLRQWMEQMTDE